MSDPGAATEAQNFPALIGVEHIEVDRTHARARTEVTAKLLQPFGIVHGGVYSSIAETVCSHATAEAVAADGMIAVGQSNNSTFLRPVSSGTIHAEAHARHTGRTTWVWDCELSDDEGRLCALVRMTVAVRPKPG